MTSSDPTANTPHRFNLEALGRGLVVSRAEGELRVAAATGAFVVTAPPGTGKSTFVPPLVADIVSGRGRVLVTQPRRVAVRAAARRISQLDGTDLGRHVGFTVRGERLVGADTTIEVLTPGVLLRRLLRDPELPGVAAVVLDEVHERSLDGDLLLAMLAEARQLRDDLVLVAMSATLDAEGISGLLGDGKPAPVVDIPAALHPLDIAHRPGTGARLGERGLTDDFLAHVARTTLEEQAAAGTDALVFLPSARDVDDVVATLRAGSIGVEVLALHGRLSSREQDRATGGRGPGDPPRIVVSTALAESSLTVPGVRLVVDAGLSREVRRDRARDMTGLVTVSTSKASAEQRAGRAARQGPGRAVRLYSEDEFARLHRNSPPEITSADLVDAALLLGAWGTPRGTGLPLLTPPPDAALDRAVEVLVSLGLTDDGGRPTPLGHRVAGMPIGARETRALVTGARGLEDLRLAAEVVAAISDDHRHADADLSALLRELRSGRSAGSERWLREVKRLERIIATEHLSEGTPDPGPSASGVDPVGFVVALARPEWIARRSADGSRSYLFASGTRAALPESSPLRHHEWLAVHEVQMARGRAADGTGAVIRLAAGLAADDAMSVGSPLLVSERTSHIDGNRIRTRLERRLGAITLSATPVPTDAADVSPAFATHIRRHGLGVLDWSPSARALRNRLALVHRELGPPWPDMSDDALLGSLDLWLGPDLARLQPGNSLARLDVVGALRRLLPWPQASRLEELVPERLPVPSGSTIAIEYPESDAADGGPVVAVKLQECFGLASTPRLVDGRVPVVFHLLSPARRPLAITADLESFWNGPYAQVRGEMRGRYPRHPWPEDPWTEPATARTKRR